MDIIVLGAGKVGRALCTELVQLDHNIVLIDHLESLVDGLMSKIDITGVIGNGALLEVQKQAGVEHADIFIAATESDEVNIVASTVAKSAGAKHTIARVRNPEYAKQYDFMKQALGIDLLINPELLAARDIARSIRYASAASVETLAGNKVSLVEVNITENSVLKNVSLTSFRLQYGSVLVCIIERDKQVFIPSGADILKEGDKIYVSGSPKDMSHFHKKTGNREKAIKSVMIVGGGRITQYVLDLLEHLHITVKVIESNITRCEQLSAMYPYAQIIHGDGTDTDVLIEQGIDEFDAFVSVTGVDEENLIISIFADKMGVRKVITKLSRTNILKVIDEQRIKKTVTPKSLVAQTVARFARSRANAVGSNIEALYRVSDEQVEVLQFRIEKQCELVGIPLANLSLKSGLLVAYILRSNHILFPTGRDTLQIGDSVIIVTTNKNLLSISDILSEK